MQNIITGTSESRLFELKKYAVTGSLNNQYFTSIDSSIDGVDVNLTITGITSSTFVYYLGGIKYVDFVTSGVTETIFEFTTLGEYDSNNFDDLNVIKLESKQNMVENPQVNSDVFIVRQQQTVFEKNYRLRGIGSLNDLLSYAGGNYFTIINNS